MATEPEGRGRKRDWRQRRSGSIGGRNGGKRKEKTEEKRKRRGNNGWDMRILQVLDQQDRRRGGQRRVRGLTGPDWEVVLVLPVWPRIMSSLLSLIRVVRVKPLARFGNGKKEAFPCWL